MGIRRRDEEEYAPTPLSVALGAVLGIGMGVVLAGFNLAAIAPLVVSELPDAADQKPGAVYFIRGGDAGGADWRASRDALVGGTGTVSLNEGQLNVWARSQFRVTAPAGDGGFLAVEVQPDVPGFRLADEQLELSSNVRMNAFGTAQNFLFQARGQFVNRGGRWEFEPEEAFLGSCPLPVTGGVARRITRSLTRKFLGHEEYVEIANAWERLREVRIAGGRLELVR